MSQSGGWEDGRPGLLQSNDLPKEYSVKNYPNPFNPESNIQYELPNDNFVSIKVFDILGKEIFELVNEFKSAGRYKVTFNGSNLPSGIYYYKMESGKFSRVKKVILIK